MNKILMFALTWGLLLTLSIQAQNETAAGSGAELITRQTPWRVWMVTGAKSMRDTNGQAVVYSGWNDKKGHFNLPITVENAKLSQLPAPTWNSVTFDESLWGRHNEDLYEIFGGFGVAIHDDLRNVSWPTLTCLRARFGIADPAAATGVKVTVEYLGGVVVYVNGTEIGRGDMPTGKIESFTPSVDYPPDAYTLEDGMTPLPAVPDANTQARFQKRIRQVTLNVPGKILTKGGNVLAVELHRAAITGPFRKGYACAWAPMGIRDIKLTATAGGIPYAKALAGTRVWSAQQVDQVCDTPVPAKKIAGNWSRPGGYRDQARQGLSSGNPFDPVVPVKILVPRNGIGNGQTILSDPDGLKGVKAELSAFQGPGGGSIPATAVKIRFGAQRNDMHWCDDLLEQPVDGARTIPVWLEITATKTLAPGWYSSVLSLTANGKSFKVPVQVFVAGFTVPDARDFRSFMIVMHSPETVANTYKVPLWSDEHFKLMERSLEMAGQLGGDVMFVPVIQGTHMANDAGLIRWKKTDKGLEPDFSLFEKYIDLYLKYCAPPQVVDLYVWSPETSQDVANVYENRQISTSREIIKAAPLQVTQWDPKTGQISQVKGPGFLDENAEAFWKPFIDGVHAIVKKRGWSERVIMLGCGGDMRPGQKVGEAWRKWAPYARWDVYSHFSGDPGANSLYKGPQLPGWAPGKLIIVGNLEVGLQERPIGGISAASLEDLWNPKNDFLYATMQRCAYYDHATPMTFRTVPMYNGRLSRLGIDYFPTNGRSRYGVPIWSSYPIRLAGRGDNGLLPTVRHQLVREALQDFEARLTLVQSLAKSPVDIQKANRALLDDFPRRVSQGNAVLSQSELSLDFPSYLARVYEAAEVVSGMKTEAKWEQPPQ